MDQFKASNGQQGASGRRSTTPEFRRPGQRNCAAPSLTARLGGDEFVIGVTGADTNELHSACAAKAQTLQSNSSVPASFGIAWESAVTAVQKALHRADPALYLAKEHGGQRTCTQEDLPGAALSAAEVGR